MRKYALLFCFLAILLFSNEFTDEQFNQYYEYAILIFRGLSGKKETTSQYCANHLANNKETLLPLFKELIEGFQNKSIDIFEFLRKHYSSLILVELYCKLLDIAGLYSNFVNDNQEYLNKTLKEFGKSLPNIIDFSVD